MANGAARTGGTGQIREMKVPAEEGQLGRVRDFIVEICGEAGLSARETSNTKLAVDEACTNIIKHAYGNGRPDGDITVTCAVSPGEVIITLQDRGRRFDFSSVEDPDLDQYVETGRKGGLGVFLINRLMDDVQYESSGQGNQLVLTKRAEGMRRAGASSTRLPSLTLGGERPFRSTLRFKFTLRAGAGLFLLMAVLWSVIFVRQSNDIESQRAARWVENRRLAENLANRSVDLLMTADEYSLEQTTLTTYLTKLEESSPALAYLRVTNADGEIVSSGNLDELFTPNQPPRGEVLLDDNGRMVWTETEVDGRDVRDIRVAVRMTNPESGQAARLGYVHVGVFEDVVEASIEDTRLATTLLLVSIFLVGLLLIVGLVQVFVRPIQLLTDGVRAIGDGNLEGKLDVQGPAEIGAIASVFNEITDKFKVAQNSILEQEKMQKEMEVAKEIQHSLLPRRKPEVSGYDIAPLYKAAAEVGGDYYDFVQVDDDTIGVVVADVSGKGVPGSLVMTMIRTALRMEARGNKNASDVMAKMNAFVTDDMKKGMFVTMFYVILDSKNRIISYSSAGHNPMVLFRAETNETYFLNPKGFPVGISLPDEELFRKSISLEKIKLKKDDMLLIYTDGVTEAMNAQREQYGEERMLAAIKRWGRLTPEEFIEKLDGDIKKFTAGHPQNDDITVVAVKEKLQADDVLFGIRKKLIELVDEKGMSVKEACEQMRVSPATYYRYKKRLETMGERGLKNKVLRKDVTINRLSLEARKEVLRIMADNPDFGPKRLADEYNRDRPEEMHVSERMIYDEFRRMGLNTRDLRIEYLRRQGILEPEPDEEGAETMGERAPGTHVRSRELVEDLLKDIPGVELTPGDITPLHAPSAPVSGEGDDGGDDDLDHLFESEGVGMSTYESDDVTEISVEGHIDSVSSSDLEKQIKRLIDDGALKIIVNLSDVSYISSGGWGIFTGEVRHLRENGGDVVLVGMTPEVYDVYELLGFADVLAAFGTTKEARAFLAKPAEERYAAPSSPDRPQPASTEGPRTPTIEDEIPDGGFVPEWESLKIEATTVGAESDVVVVQLRGIIDTVSAENMRRALESIIGRGIVKIVVDMSGVEYVSSGGWGTFTERLREVRREGGDIKLFGMDPDVYYVFTMLGFNIVLSSFDILTEAIEDFRKPAPASGVEPVAPGAGQEPPPADEQPTEEDIEEYGGLPGEALDIPRAPGGDAAGAPESAPEREEAAEDIPQGGGDTPESDAWMDDAAEALEESEPFREAPGPDEESPEPESAWEVSEPVPEEDVPEPSDETSGFVPEEAEPADETPGLTPPEAAFEPVDEASEPVTEEEPSVPVDETHESVVEMEEEAPEPVDGTTEPEREAEPLYDAAAAEDAGEAGGGYPLTPSEPVAPPARMEGLTGHGVDGVVDWECTEDGVVLSRLHGAIEAAAAEALRQAMNAVLLGRPRAVVFDYRDVPYVSSAGWGLVAACYEACSAWGGVVALFGLNSDLFDIYTGLELNALVRVHGAEAEALRSVRASMSVAPPAPPEEAADTRVLPEGEPAPELDYAGPSGEDTASGGAVPDVTSLGAETLEEDIDPEAGDGQQEADRPQVVNWRDAAGDEADEDVADSPSPLDEPAETETVDMSSARSDRNVDLDRKLRDMGWSEYGERLRRIQRRERKDRGDEDD